MRKTLIRARGFLLFWVLCGLSIVIAFGAHEQGAGVDTFVWSAAGLMFGLMALIQAKGEIELLSRGFDRYFVEVRRESESGKIKTEMLVTYAKSKAEALAVVFRPGDVPLRCGKLEDLGLRAAAWVEFKNLFV